MRVSLVNWHLPYSDPLDLGLNSRSEVWWFMWNWLRGETAGFSGSYREGIKSFEFAMDKSIWHIPQLLAGTLATIAWIRKKFNGHERVKGFTWAERKSNLEFPGSDSSIFDFLYAAATSIFGFEEPDAEDLDPWWEYQNFE